MIRRGVGLDMRYECLKLSSSVSVGPYLSGRGGKSRHGHSAATRPLPQLRLPQFPPLFACLSILPRISFLLSQVPLHLALTLPYSLFSR
jgi:hypothetical protein